MADVVAEHKEKHGDGYYFGLAMLVVFVGVGLLNILQHWLDSVFPNEYFVEKGFLYLALLVVIVYLSRRVGLNTLSERVKERRDMRKRKSQTNQGGTA